VAEKSRDRCVYRERDVGATRKLAQLPGVIPVDPEATLEIDLARAVATLDEQLYRRLGALV
jgi:hypothetical protein